MKDETWRWVAGYEGLYLVSNRGAVISLPSSDRGRRSGTTLKPQDNGKGYKIVMLYKNGKGTFKTVHKIVAEAFVGNPQQKPDINHKDGNKANNAAENLEWVTKKENMTHATEKLDALGFNRVLSEEQVLAIRKDTRTQDEIAKDYGLSQSTISNIIRGKTYKKYL